MDFSGELKMTGKGTKDSKWRLSEEARVNLGWLGRGGERNVELNEL